MRIKNAIQFQFVVLCCFAMVLAFTLPALSQSNSDQNSTSVQNTPKSKKNKKEKSAGREMGQGSKDIGVGAAKGSVDLGKGVAGGAGDLVTGHPVVAAASVGGGAVGFGRHAGVGAGKGSYKIGKGIGRLFHHHKKPQD